ncbi:MAG: UDP-glucose/GDP-mannose dehydrogenase family protein [Deferribacteraceae bacterium]|jgi:UDPglucose 6-dehydrogenase|nr:UDP-glucose/GDP-mannose dehydrogenase family protein [Deferribacteraceae bacterium]
MKIAIIGTGYVGLPTGVGLAEFGNDVVCIDKIEQKITDLNAGKITLYEDGLEELFIKNKNSGKLKFTTDMESGVEQADVVIIAVGTPTHPITKEADLKYIYAAAGELAQYLAGYTVIAVKSTVPVGTGDNVEDIIKTSNPNADFDVVSLPEFLREGFAVEDFFNPDRIVIGANSERAKAKIAELYTPFNGKTNFLYVARRSSEAIKYAANSFLAVKVHYINEMADFCERSGADIDEVAKGMGLDSRLGAKFLQPGPGYGGSCFPKDTTAMVSMAKGHGVDLNIVETAVKQNALRKIKMAERICNAVKEVEKPTIGVLGLTFKGGTDDVRESPAMEIIQEIIKSERVSVKAYDPKGLDNAKSILTDGIYYAKNAYDACKGTDLCVVLTEWVDFKEIDLAKLKEVMNTPSIMDLRNLLDRDTVRNAGFKYSRIGEADGN